MPSRQTLKWIAPAFLATFFATSAVYAQNPDVQAEERAEATAATTADPMDQFELEASLIGTYQSASDGRIDDEAGLRPEVLMTIPVFGYGRVHLHAEGSTTPKSSGVTTFLPDANANIGPATNSSGHGRLQMSEAYYEVQFGGLGVNVGLLDTTAFLDSSAIMGDEHTQFVNATLVHNATIEFPDYTLGVVMTTEGEGAMPGLTLVAGSTNGLGDNPSKTYSELFDVRSSGKGVFAAAEAGWGLEALGDDGAARIGAWVNTADHAYVDLTPGTTDNKGVYGVLEGTAIGTGWSLRAGLADESASAADWFVGAALQRNITDELVAGIRALTTRTLLSIRTITCSACAWVCRSESGKRDALNNGVSFFLPWHEQNGFS